MNSVLFLSHSPHEAHLGFARAIGATVKLLPFEKTFHVVGAYPVLGGYAFATLSFIRALFMRVQADVLLVDGGLPIPTAVALKKKYKNIKVIYLDADLFLYSLRNRPTELKLLHGLIDGIITVSEENKKYLPSFLDVPVYICPPFPKMVCRRDVMRKNYGLYVGRLDPDKNIERIIDFGLQCPYFEKFIIVGDGTLRSYVERVARKNNKLLYVGRQKDVAYYYNQCTFLIHIPDRDPHPTVTMEAALCGCFPIISKKVGTAYLFDDLFVVDDPNDFPAINKKIGCILQNNNNAQKLLRQSVLKMPTKESALRTFRESFFKIVNASAQKEIAKNFD